MTTIQRDGSGQAVAMGFIPSAWASRALEVLRENIVMTKLVARDTAFDAGWVGQTLNIPYPGKFTAVDKVANTVIAPQTPTGGATVSLTLNKHKAVDFLVEDFAAAQSDQSLMDRFVNPAAIAIAEQLEADLFGLYAGMSGTTSGTAGTALSYATILNTMKALTDNKAPLVGRNLVISTKDQVALLSDTTLQQYFAYNNNGANKDAIQQGKFATIGGFDIYVSQGVLTTGSAPIDTKNIAFLPEAFLLATRPFREIPAGAGVQSMTMTDEVSGISIRVIHQYDVNYRGMRVGFDILYGCINLRPELGVLVHS